MSRAENKNNDQINAFASAKDEFLTEIDINIVSMKEEESPSTRRPEVTFMDCFEFLNQQKNNGREHFVNENGSGLEIPDRLFVSDVVSPKLLGYLTVQDLFSSPVDIKIISLLRNCDVVFRTSTSLETALKTYIRVADGEGTFIGVAGLLDVNRRAEACFESHIARNNCLKTINGVQYIFEELIEKRLAITLFPTMLLGTGGDAGSQSSAIRGLATVKYNIGAHSGICYILLLKANFSLSNFKSRVLKQELFTGLLIATYALKVSVALFVVWAVAARAQVPLLLEYCGADPAQCASPVLATATDIVGVFVI